jgi:hypothetical protein
MSADQPLPCISSSKRVLLAAHPARATFISELSKAQEEPLHESSRIFMKAVAHADGLIVWKTKSNGDYLIYQWIFDSHANRDSTSFILDLKRSTPNENRGDKRKAVPSRLRYGL